ncbi:MAG: dTMP kinase [Clostridia bacterium]|nr:dTMP kinase [Clostridia bacterium]
MRGPFITLEGIDGSGKSTQADLLSAYLGRCGWAVVRTREPGGTALGEQIRRLVLETATGNLNERAELLLYLADRAQHVAEVIWPALQSGKAVVCDRFGDSSLAYQGYARGLGLELIQRLNRFAAGGLEPDLTLYLDVPVEIGLRRRHRDRRKNGLDRIEKETLEFHQRVRAGFLELARREPERFRLIDACGTVEEVFAAVRAIVDSFLRRWQR